VSFCSITLTFNFLLLNFVQEIEECKALPFGDVIDS